MMTAVNLDVRQQEKHSSHSVQNTNIKKCFENPNFVDSFRIFRVQQSNTYVVKMPAENLV